jgi:hypothetical protein
MISAYVRCSVKPRVSRAPRLEQALHMSDRGFQRAQSLGENELLYIGTEAGPRPNLQ